MVVESSAGYGPLSVIKLSLGRNPTLLQISLLGMLDLFVIFLGFLGLAAHHFGAHPTYMFPFS